MFQWNSFLFYLGYKAHHDCTVNGLKQDRYATFLVYLNTVMEGGETEFTGEIFIFILNFNKNKICFFLKI